MSPALNLAISTFDIAFAMRALTVPFLLMIPIAVWMHSIGKKETQREEAVHEGKGTSKVSLIPLLKFALKDRDYRLIVIGFATCGFNMSIIESHLFSQYLSYGIDGSTASLTLTVYGIATMIGAAGTGFLGAAFKMKNVLAGVYAAGRDFPGLSASSQIGGLCLCRHGLTGALRRCHGAADVGHHQ